MLNLEIALLNIENEIDAIQAQLTMNGHTDSKTLMELSIALNAQIQAWLSLKNARDKSIPAIGTLPPSYQTGA